ncbi:MAG: hypothetical protein ACE5H7_07755 [Acidiferrobacterales bacterium]
MRRRQGLKRVLDVRGHCARPDVFELRVYTDACPLIETMAMPSGSVGAGPEVHKPGQT